MFPMFPMTSDCNRSTQRVGILLGLVFAGFGSGLSQNAPAPTPPGVSPSNIELASPVIERRVNALLKQMTLEEKLGQLVQYSDAGFDGPVLPGGDDANAPGKN